MYLLVMACPREVLEEDLQADTYLADETKLLVVLPKHGGVISTDKKYNEFVLKCGLVSGVAPSLSQPL